MKLDAKEPSGPIAARWDRHKFEMKLVNPANKRKYTIIVVGTGLGWGLVTLAAPSWLSWQGYLLGPFGLGGRDGAWAYANLGVLVALLVGFLGTLLFSARAVRRQEGRA